MSSSGTYLPIYNVEPNWKVVYIFELCRLPFGGSFVKVGE